MSAPFKSFRVSACGERHAYFEILVQPGYWRRGEEALVEEQRLFIREAIANALERLEKEQGESSEQSKTKKEH